MHEGSYTGVRSVQRAIDILSLLSEDRLTLSVREIVEATRLPKTTVLRLLHTLEDNQLLGVGDDGCYTVGAGLLRWNRLAAERWGLPPHGREMLRELAQEWQETVHVYIRQGTDRVCVAQEEGTHSLRQVVRVGDVLPLWAGGVAKVLLSDAPLGLLTRVARHSPYGESHLGTLRAWAEEALAAGFAVSHGEREEGLSAVAVPIRDAEGRVSAALAFGGPTARFTHARTEKFVAALQAVARRLESG